MPTLNREQLNQILELMLENQASDPGSMVVVDGDKKVITGEISLSELLERATNKRDVLKVGDDGNITKQRAHRFGVDNEKEEDYEFGASLFNLFEEAKTTAKEMQTAAIEQNKTELEAKQITIAQLLSASLIRNMAEQVRGRAAKISNLSEEEKQNIQMICDLNSKNIIAISPTGNPMVFGIGDTLEMIYKNATSIVKEAQDEDANYLKLLDDLKRNKESLEADLENKLASIYANYVSKEKEIKKKLVDLESKLKDTGVIAEGFTGFTKLITETLKDKPANSVNEDMAIKELKGTQNRELKPLRRKLYEIQQNKSLSEEERNEQLEKTQKEISDKERDHNLVLAIMQQGSDGRKQMAVMAKQQDQNIASLVSLAATFMKDAETPAIKEAKAEVEKIKSDMEQSKAQIESIEREYDTQVKEIVNTVNQLFKEYEANVRRKDDQALEKRKAKISYDGWKTWLPQYFGGLSEGLIQQMTNKAADQAKAMETAQLVSIDVSSDPDQPQQDGIELKSMKNLKLKKETEILAEKMRLRGLRASIEKSLEDNSVFVEEDMELLEDSSVISDISTTSEPDPEMVFEFLKRAFTYNYQSLEEYKTIREVREEVVRAEELTKKSREQIDIFKKQLEFLNQLKSHAENSVTGVTGLDIVKQKLEKSLLNPQEQSDIKDMLEGKATSPKITNLRAYAAGKAQRGLSILTGEGGAASVDMLDSDTLGTIIEGIENQINELEKTIAKSEENVSEANKRALDPTHGDQAKDVAAKVSAYESLLTERGVSEEEINKLKTAVYKSDDDSMKDRIMTNSLFSPEALRDEFAKITEGSSISSQSSAGLEDDSYDDFDSEREYATDEERLPIDIIMAGLEANAEQSLLARKKLALLAQLEVMSPATLNTAGKLDISHEYLEKLEKLERLYSGPTLTAESLKEHDREVSSQSSFGSSSDSDNSSVISAASTETSMDEKVDATSDESVSAPTPQDLVARYNLCYTNLAKEIRKHQNLSTALTGEIGGELVADNLQTVAKQASAITEAEVANFSISRKDAQKITDAAMAELLEEASNVGINLTALTENNGDNRLFNKLKDATITEFRCDEFGNCIPVKDEEGNEVKDAFGFPQYETEEVRIFPEGVVGLVKKGELDFLSFLSLDRRSWSNVTTKALNAAIDLLNGLIKMVNFVLSEQLKLGEWIKYTLPYQEITAAQLADVFLIKGDSQEKLINKGVDLSVFAMLHKKAIVLSTMQDALAITTDKDFVTRFSHAVRKNFAETANPQMIEQARKTMQKELLFGKGTGKDRYKGLKESVSAYAFNSLIAKQYRVYRAIVSQMTANQEENQAVIRRQLGNLNNTEDLVRTILQAVPLDDNTSLNDEFKIGPDANAMEIIAAARGLVESRKTAEGSIGNTNVASEKVMKQLDYVEKIKESMHTLDHSDVEAEIKVAVKRMTATLEAMEKITNESTEADCLQKIEADLPAIEESLKKKLNALPEPVRKALAGKSIDARVEEKFGAMWLVNPLKYLTTKDHMRDKVIQEVLATANAGTVDGVTYTEEHIKQVEEFLQLQSMQEDLIGIQQEIMRNNDLMRASTKASVENKDLHKEVKALYTQALEAFPGADFDPSKLEAEYKGKKMTVNKVDKDAKYISMPTRMIPVFVKALQEANLDKDYKAAQQAFTEAKSAVASQKQTITGLEEKRTEAQKALTAAQQEYDNFSGEKEMPIQEDLDAPLLQNDAQNPQPTPKWQAVMDRLEAAKKAVTAADDNVASEQTKLEGLVDVATKAKTKLDDDFDKVKIETYQKALTAMSTGLDSRTQAAVEGFKQHKERKDTITTRVKKAGDLMEKLQSSQQPSTPSVSRSNSSDDPEQGLDSNNPNGPGK